MENFNFDALVNKITHTQDALQENARLVINRHVTAKAWLTGYYIVEYEQNGSDKATYGEKLLQKLAERLSQYSSMSHRSLKLYRQFYITYKTLQQPIIKYLTVNSSIGQSVSAQLQKSDNKSITIGQTLSAQLMELNNEENVPHPDPQKMFDRLSLSHLTAILPLKDPLKRAFYETMAIRGTWSVRELQRQIDTNYYERSGWSNKPDALADLVDGSAEKNSIGILMCSEVGKEMAEYTLLDTDENVFISKYQLSVPSKERITEFLRKENEGLTNLQKTL